MKNNKLITLLRTLSTSDLYHFRKYISSPFFNEHTDLVQFFDYLRKSDFSNYLTDKGDQKLSIWNFIYPNKKYNDTRFRRLCSDLLQLAFDFLAYRQYQQNPINGRVMLLRSLSSAKLEKHFAGVVRQTKRELEQNDLLDADFHYLTYMLHRRQHERQEHVAQKAASFEFLEKADHHLDCYYLTKKLEHYSDTLGYQDIITSTAKVNLPPQFLDYIENSPYRKELSVRAWHLVVLMKENPDEESFFLHLKKLVEEKGHHFQERALKALLIHLMNYCIDTKIHRGRTEYYGELFSLYQAGLNSKVIYENGKLPLQQYKNIIALSLHLGKFEWVEQFIQTKTADLPKQIQENALNFNLANIYFHQGQYDKVVGQLSMVEYQTIEYALGGKLLLMQSYFELEEIQAFDSLTDSFKIYLRRNRLISKEVKQRYLNFLRFAKKIGSLAPYDEKGWEKVNGQIDKCKALVGKKWLMEKVEKKGQ